MELNSAVEHKQNQENLFWEENCLISLMTPNNSKVLQIIETQVRFQMKQQSVRLNNFRGQHFLSVLDEPCFSVCINCAYYLF